MILSHYSLKSNAHRSEPGTERADGSSSAPHGGQATLDRISARSAAKIGSENFPVALRLLPAQPRAQLARVYAYARFVDDVGDTAEGDRRELLDRVEAEVRALWDAPGTSRIPAVAGLRPVIDACALPADPLLELIEANRVDQERRRYGTFDDLLGYCRLSAAPVGRIVLYIAGAVNAANVADSDQVCAALQVLEHCQDVGEDARAGRIYLPAADLREAGVAESDLLARTTSPGLRRAVAVQVGRCDEMLGAGRDLVGRLSGRPRLAVSGYLGGGLATADALRAARFRVLEHTVRPRKLHTISSAIRVAARP